MSNIYLPRNACPSRMRQADNARQNRPEIVEAYSHGQISRREMFKWGVVTAGGLIASIGGLSPFVQSAHADIANDFAAAEQSVAAEHSRQALLYEGVPVSSSREWIDFLMRADNGDLIWGTQGQTNDGSNGANGVDPLHVDFILVNLTTGTSVVIPVDTRFVYRHDEGSFVGHPTLSRTNQKIDPHGNLWIPAANNHLFKVPRGAQTVIQLPQIQDHPPGHPELPNNNPVTKTPNDSTQYTQEFNHDGSKLYTGTQSNWLPAIFEIDTNTDATRVVGHVGKHRIGFSYAYYMAIDGDWVYVCVGKQPWELCCLSVSTGEMRLLQTVPATGNMAFTIQPGIGIYVTMDTDLEQPDNLRTQFWCVDGAITYPYLPREKPADTAKKFAPRDCTPSSNPVSNPPQIDDSPGMGLVRWRPNGSTGPWTSVHFPVPHSEAIDIESLTILPNGDVLGNAVNYQGFFRYVPSTKSTIWYGAISGVVSRGPRLVVDGLVWIAGYPNGKLYAYDPSRDWEEAAGNPVQHANFHASGMKYASFLDYSPTNGRLYCAGRREREGFGTGLGWYDIAARTFGGTDLNLNLVNPQGLLMFHDGVVVSTTPSEDPSVPVPPPDAQLILFTPDLVEIERQTVVPAMKDTGSLFRASQDNSIVVGLVKTQGAEMLYRHDLRHKKVVSTKMLGKPVGASWQDATTGSAYAVIGGILYAINLTTLAMTQVSDAPQVATADLFVVTATEIVIAVGPTLYVLERGGVGASIQ